MKKLSVVLVVILSMLLCVTLMGCYDSRPDIEVVIYHTNDSHSRVDAQANSDCIGFAKIATIKNNTPNSVLVDAGDTFHGLPIATLSQGESIVRMMNAAGYDYMTTGNHDYNYGLDRLLELEAMAKFKLLVANVVYKADNSNVFAAWDIKNFDGLKVGFFGLATSDTLTSTVPANVEDLIFEDSVEIARECVTELKNRGCRAIVAITHLGDTSINGSETSQLVASNVDGIDVIIDGHSHSTYPDGKKVNDTIICSTGNYLNNLGRVSLSFTKGYLTSKEARLISAAATVDTEEDAKTAEVVNEIRNEVAASMDVVIGNSDVTMISDRKYARSQELPLGNFMADLFNKYSGSDVTIINGGGIRSNLEAGDITVGDIISIMPFSNTHQIKEITPAVLYAAIEHGTGETVLNAEGTWVDQTKLFGKFPQVAGMKYSVDFSKPVGSRVTIWLDKDNGEVLDRNDNTTIITVSASNFMLSGGDGYTMFADRKVIADMGTEDQIFVNYIKEIGKISEMPKLGRIMYYNGETLLINPLA